MFAVSVVTGFWGVVFGCFKAFDFFGLRGDPLPRKHIESQGQRIEAAVHAAGGVKNGVCLNPKPYRFCTQELQHPHPISIHSP